MENKIVRPLIVRLLLGVLLVFACLAALNAVLIILRPNSVSGGYVLVMNAIEAVLFGAAFTKVKERRDFGRWLAIGSFAFMAGHAIWHLLWLLFFSVFPTPKVTIAIFVGLDISEMILFGAAAMILAFSSKVKSYFHAEELPFESSPPPPPSFS